MLMPCITVTPYDSLLLLLLLLYLTPVAPAGRKAVPQDFGARSTAEGVDARMRGFWSRVLQG